MKEDISQFDIVMKKFKQHRGALRNSNSKKDCPKAALSTITRKKMSPTSIGVGSEYQNRRECISLASCDAKLVPVGKGQEEALSIDKAGTMAL